MQSVIRHHTTPEGSQGRARRSRWFTNLVVFVLLALALLPGSAVAVAPAQETTCSVRSAQLNLREGPGIGFTVITTLVQGTQLKQLQRTTNGWLRVETQTTPKRTGYVNGAAQFVTCTTGNGGSNTAQGTRRIITPPGDGDGVDGFVSVDPVEVDQGFIAFRDDQDIITFRRSMWLRAEGFPSGNRDIDHVVFSVSSQSYFDPDAEDENGFIYTRSEFVDGYCIFGGGEPNCTPVSLRAGATWPGTNHPIYNGSYGLSIAFFLDGSPEDDADATWFATLIINSPNLSEAPGNEGQGAAFIEAELVEVAPGDDNTFADEELALRVRANDPGIGFDDGDGIDEVLIQVFDPDDVLVHERTEVTAGYCAFGGGEPACNRFDFEPGESTWPESGDTVQVGSHRLEVTVFADDGRSATYDFFFEIE